MEQSDLQGKVAIVTGSATGIGAAVALGLAKRGANLVINYTKSEAEARATVAAIEALGRAAVLQQGDIAQDRDCKAIAHTALSRWNRIDILVNNAGTTKFAAFKDLDALSADDFTGLYAVNVVGAFQMARACAKNLAMSGEGTIVNISSLAGLAGIGSSIAYAASKGALNTLTLALARTLAPEIRVNAVCPGFVATRWFKDRFDADTFARIAQEQTETVPLKRIADAEEIAKTVLFFCGPESRHLTGEFLVTDGGLHLQVGGRR